MAQRIEDRIAYSIAEFAALIGRGEPATRQAARRGSIPTVRIGGRVMVPGAYVDAIRAGNETPEPDSAQE